MGNTLDKMRGRLNEVRRARQGRRILVSEEPCVCVVNRRVIERFTSTESELSMNLKHELTARDAPDSLECPICCNYMSSKIYTCVNNHSVCGDCNSQMKYCPFCKEDIRYRDLGAELEAGRYRIPCRFEVFGCKEKIIGRRLEAHLLTCAFRHLICSMCEKCIPTNDALWFHLGHEHSLIASSINKGNIQYYIHAVDFSKDEFRWSLRWFTCFETNFLCHFEKYKETWCFWISAEDSTKFSCTISFLNEKMGSQMKYEGPVNHLREGLQDVVKTGNGLILDVEQLQLFITDGKFAYITFCIFQTPEEIEQKPPRTRIATHKEPVASTSANTSSGPSHPNDETFEGMQARTSAEHQRRRLWNRVRRHSYPDAERGYFTL